MSSRGTGSANSAKILFPRKQSTPLDDDFCFGFWKKGFFNWGQTAPGEGGTVNFRFRLFFAGEALRTITRGSVSLVERKTGFPGPRSPLMDTEHHPFSGGESPGARGVRRGEGKNDTESFPPFRDYSTKPIGWAHFQPKQKKKASNHNGWQIFSPKKPQFFFFCSDFTTFRTTIASA